MTNKKKDIKDYKKRKYILSPLLLIIFPIIGYLIINHFYPLNPNLYSTTALTGYYAVCLSISLDLFDTLKKKKDISIILSIALLLFIFPLVGYYLFSLIIPLNSIIFAGIGFGAFFGVCIDKGIRLWMPIK